MFWIISTAVVVLTALAILWPLLSGDSRWKASGLLVLLLIPASVFWQYQMVGTPRALQPVPAVAQNTNEASLDELVVSLRQKLTESAADLEGWVLLGRSYKTLQDYPAAVEALETANRLVPDEPVVLVELVEARLFASGNPIITPSMTELLQQAVSKQPELQKGWWLLGIAAAQSGDDAQAIVYWRKLLQGMEPGSAVARSVQGQIEEAEARLGISNPAASPESVWESPSIRIDLTDEARKSMSSMPESRTLFLIARVAGESSGPPLAVKRINQPVFPLDLVLSDADSMMPQRPVSANESIQIQARLSASGNALAVSGDWQSDAAIMSRSQTEEISLVIDQPLD